MDWVLHALSNDLSSTCAILAPRSTIKHAARPQSLQVQISDVTLSIYGRQFLPFSLSKPRQEQDWKGCPSKFHAPRKSPARPPSNHVLGQAWRDHLRSMVAITVVHFPVLPFSYLTSLGAITHQKKLQSCLSLQEGMQEQTEKCNTNGLKAHIIPLATDMSNLACSMAQHPTLHSQGNANVLSEACQPT